MGRLAGTGRSGLPAGGRGHDTRLLKMVAITSAQTSATVKDSGAHGSNGQQTAALVLEGFGMSLLSSLRARVDLR